MDGPPQDAPREPIVPRTVTCPSCGVAVQVGYPRCPRCQSPVPAPPRAKRATARDTLAGGTTVAPEAPRRIGWLVAAGIVLVAGSVGVWLASRSDRPAAGATEPDEAEEEEDEGEDEVAEPGGEPEPAGRRDDPTPTPAGRGAAAAGAVRQLEAALRDDRLWARVSHDAEVVVIESSLCDDPGMWPAIMAEAATLRAVGLAAVRCTAPHGGVVFERGL